MRHLLPTLMLVAATAVGCSGTNKRSDAPAAPLTTYAVDAGQSSVVFKSGHLDASDLFGRFNKVNGTLKFSESNLANSSIRVVVDAGSLDTNSGDRDNHVKGPDLFNVGQFPEIVFEGTGFRKLRGDRYRVTGNLTFHGVTKSIEVVAVKQGPITHERFGTRMGFTTSFTVLRSDYGMGLDLGSVSDEVQIMVGIEGVQQ